MVTKDVADGAVVVGIPARATVVTGGKAPEAPFMPYGTPCTQMFDPATQQLEILRCEINRLQGQIDDLIRDQADRDGRRDRA